MFSLLITLISIALVAALVLASMYYLNNTHGIVQASARASTILSQAEQLAGASRVYKQYEGAWPATTAALIASQYLRGVPDYSNVTWAPVGSVASNYLLPGAVDLATCKSFNQRVRQVAGIHAEAIEELQVQCFGPTAPYSVLLRVDSPLGLAVDLPAALPGATLVSSAADATWAVAP